MDLKVIERSNDSLELSFTDMDISLLTLLQKLLLKDKRVKSASVKRVHPLTKENLLFMKTVGDDPKLILEETLDAAYNLTKGLKEDLISGLK
ncbi:MAG: hypothetical protein JRN19_00760 [Nitrososphaerota archaeon]|jgi:DNA-directed RNA polymerase subunit L|nr:hypothetical protein [Nitrososphaerota archaeon]MDG7044005.1 hypothetical protein [Nitrososphaerota archaeon]MDG7047066.1 hypothetical protein [Nitrososphaerota archaeon]MDG7047964.1 hypothetical protein [Nitrososphaerota archaeon]MDG7050980.1 hypothetical protein [Nitrososphaerota archaeon]